MSKTLQEQEQFTQNCRYLGLKVLGEEYQNMIGQATKSDVGYFQFINQIIQAEAIAQAATAC